MSISKFSKKSASYECLRTLFSKAKPGIIGYLANRSQTQNIKIIASPSVIVTITWADLQGLSVRKYHDTSTIDSLPTGVLGGIKQIHPLREVLRCSRRVPEPPFCLD